MSKRYDAIVVGAGQAGPSIAGALAAQGQRVALTEAEHLGGTCLNHGCRPTKAMRASARAAHLARRGADYGFTAGEVHVDFAAVMARKDALIAEMRESFVTWLRSVDLIEVFDGETRFEESDGDGYALRAGDAELGSDRVYLDIGMRPLLPPIDGLDAVAAMTEIELLALKELPEHLVVIGGGYIGLEFAQMFRRFGSQVTIVAGRRIAPREDADVAEALADVLRGEGVVIRAGRAERVEGDGQDVVVHAGDGEPIRGTHLLVAAGRAPNTDRLNLQAAGVEVDDRGTITTDEQFRTTAEGIWALGDCNGRGAFTHTAYQDAEILLGVMGLKPRLESARTVAGRLVTSAMFTDPPLARIGMSEREARDSGRRVLAASMPMDQVTKARLDGETDGLMKVLVDADTDRIIGATVFGLQGDDVIQVVGAVMQADQPYQVLRDALPVHPTVSEFWPTLFGNLTELT